MATIAGVIDMVWYVLVALLLAESKIIKSFRKNAVAIDRCIGLVLGAFASALTFNIIGINLFQLIIYFLISYIISIYILT